MASHTIAITNELAEETKDIISQILLNVSKEPIHVYLLWLKSARWIAPRLVDVKGQPRMAFRAYLGCFVRGQCAIPYVSMSYLTIHRTVFVGHTINVTVLVTVVSDIHLDFLAFH